MRDITRPTRSIRARAGIIGALASLIAMVVVTLMTAPPDKATQDMVDEVRIPKGDTILGSTH